MVCLILLQQIAKHHIDTEQEDQSLLSGISTGETATLENAGITMVTEIGVKNEDTDAAPVVSVTGTMQDVANLWYSAFKIVSIKIMLIRLSYAQNMHSLQL